MPRSPKLPDAKPAVKTVARKRAAPRPDPEDMDDDGMDDGADEEVEQRARRPTRRMAPGDRQQAELKAALHAKLTGEPVFKFPAELHEDHRPYWVEVVNCKPHDYFNMGDIHLLKLYCRVAADIDRLDREIAGEGSVVLNARGNPIVNPRVLVRAMAETRMMTLSTKLRLQPSSRYNSEQDTLQGEKKKKVDKAVRALGDDDDDLLARSPSASH